MLDSFQSREVRTGRPVELPCIASGYPNPAVRWIKDGRPLPADSRWTKRITGLTISDLRVEDSGTYICEVTNTFGSAEVTGTLTVIGESRRGERRTVVGTPLSRCLVKQKAFINRKPQRYGGRQAPRRTWSSSVASTPNLLPWHVPSSVLSPSHLPHLLAAIHHLPTGACSASAPGLA